jgi:predicted RNase H-like HicB family nuclease
MAEHVYSVWVIARPSKDVEGQWVGHCVEFDVVSQGDSLDHAIRMVLEATSMVVLDDLQKHRDPRQRRAPEDYFETLSRVISSGQKVPLDLALADTSRKRLYAIPFRLALETRSIAPKKAKAKAKPKPVPANVAFTEQVAS